MNVYLKLIGFVFLSLLFACESLQPALEQAMQEVNNTPSQSNALTEAEVVAGLKDALKVGTEKAVKIVTKPDGFFKDELIKIALPPEAKVITDNKDHIALKTLGLTSLIDDVVLRMNRSAEDASKQATVIFLNAIQTMSIQDAFNILNGDDNAATNYFRAATLPQLLNAFSPEIKKSLDKPLVAGVSTNKAWYNLTNPYNKVAKFSTDLKEVDTDLSRYVTQKAIDGLFLKLEAEEKLIRKDPLARITDILKKVFAYND
jgi:hypothetical protein